ncbi:beta-1,4-galactosyltransferase 7-like isoform X1 [Amphibalanus amphitrite]|uniref:beta-1,4-galactosyltransferase 7-like isoform X1 n=1 Tax=Amphibalanus amphitrite TaxID=1232801 RepID=UPI001C9101A9|nr:beta-1,4-galactosyltransferase 7-like isoform X1 [Amphibalanus amphitrite]XP_043225067.1 beta-1,4-galactosyltransferase 7-like isoform X1 [Amphibalanus amphitrite]XP_043225068.1 beta-1,4-galactosyltransferase 7-like isoform X1 [Amphibalanus amphitrite]XP_043225069.1 beta-1,4-galactosyltransferase 7-like isoform X1 [Amphibalanus amphitrite]
MRITTVVSSRLFLSIVIVVLLFFIAVLLTRSDEAVCPPPPAAAAEQSPPEPAAEVTPSPAPSAPAPSGGRPPEPDTSSWDNHTLAVVVPFRDRFEEMLIFVPYMHRFLNFQKVKHRIYIVNQIDAYRFNRASLINVGYLRAREHCDYMAMHDVDLLPLNRNLSYRFPGERLFHVASPEYHPRYHYPKFVGGILIVTMEHFQKVNGMSNNYWGWGLEDDEFYTRIRGAKLEIERPTNLTTGVKDTFRHIHDRRVRKRDMEKCFNQAAVTHKRDRITGVHSVDYKILKANKLTIDGAEVEVLNVRLECDHERTPWCDCSGQAAEQEAAARRAEDSGKAVDAAKPAGKSGDSVKPAPSAKAHPKTSAGRAAAAQSAAQT